MDSALPPLDAFRFVSVKMFNLLANTRETQSDETSAVDGSVLSSVTSPTACPVTDLQSTALSTASATYVAAYGNSNPSNVTSDWLPVISCTSEVGIPNNRECQMGNIINPPAGVCYVRLDIQIAYTKIGSVLNPQSVLSAVIFHYQKMVSSQSSSLVRQRFDLDDGHESITHADVDSDQ